VRAGQRSAGVAYNWPQQRRSGHHRGVFGRTGPIRSSPHRDARREPPV